MSEKYMTNLSSNSMLEEILAHPEGEKILRKHLGPTLDHPHMQNAMGRNLKEIIEIVNIRAPGRYPEEILDLVDSDLKKI